MELDLNGVKRLAHLSRLAISDDEAATTLVRLRDLFSLVEQMRAVDTTGITPLAHPLEQLQPMAARLRDDGVTEVDRRSDYQQPAPAVQDGLYLVPKVVE